MLSVKNMPVPYPGFYVFVGMNSTGVADYIFSQLAHLLSCPFEIQSMPIFLVNI